MSNESDDIVIAKIPVEELKALQEIAEKYDLPGKFIWGRIEEVHVLGPYQFVEYWPKNRDPHNPLEHETHKLFHGYHDGKDMHQGWFSLEEAVIGAIACIHDGRNSQAGTLIARMLGIETHE